MEIDADFILDAEAKNFLTKQIKRAHLLFRKSDELLLLIKIKITKNKYILNKTR